MEISLINKENFDWKTYLRKYKDIKNVTDCDSAWDHWVNKGKKQGRKFYTLIPDKYNNFYILTKEYIKRKNKNNNNNNIVYLSEDSIITDYVSNLKQKIYKMRINQTIIKEEENNIIKEENNIIKEENNIIKEENNIIKEEKVNLEEKKNNLDKKVKVDEHKVKLDKKKNLNKKVNLEKKKNSKKKVKEEWSNNSENSDIFFMDTNNDEYDNSSENSEKYFNKLKNNDYTCDKPIKLNNKTIKIIDEEKSNKSNTSNK
jgi:hypothetical protein